MFLFTQRWVSFQCLFLPPQQEAVPEDLIKSTSVSLTQWMQSIVLFFKKKHPNYAKIASHLSLHLTPVIDPLADKKKKKKKAQSWKGCESVISHQHLISPFSTQVAYIGSSTCEATGTMPLQSSVQ